MSESEPKSAWPTNFSASAIGRQVKTSERVASAIVTLIVDNGLKPGDRLPNEAEMIEQFEVGRGSLREALRILETYGMISLRSGPGGGPVLLSVNPRDVSRSFSLYLNISGATVQELVDARLIIDPQAARMAAEAISDESKAAILATLDREESVRPTAGTVVEAANDFHYLLATLTGNGVFNLVATALKEMYTTRVVGVGLAEKTTKPTIRHEHRRIGDAVIAGDGDLAERLMREHLIEHFAQTLDASPGFGPSVINWG
ncbi:FadR/GntR family transcriptional regulator [Subtercola endophyticus]|uniref:FadR/GntR family transcriptional regulator n=1 Tax=Subtercola endophyticus TaxID=2895559 RepID=UPI001E2F1498|nr:FadR/GntR family transcriptional regulator [Subtercola endophyticus]UFS58098.1 FadR family transcriptional regulator [Subtercola endophyticus]